MQIFDKQLLADVLAHKKACGMFVFYTNSNEPIKHVVDTVDMYELEAAMHINNGFCVIDKVNTVGKKVYAYTANRTGSVSLPFSAGARIYGIGLFCLSDKNIRTLFGYECADMLIQPGADVVVQVSFED